MKRQPDLLADATPKPTPPPDADLHEDCRKVWNDTVGAAGAQQCRKINRHRRDRLRYVLPELATDETMPTEPLAAWLRLCEILIADGWVTNAKSIDDVLNPKGTVINKALESASAKPKADLDDDDDIGPIEPLNGGAW